MIAQNSAVVWKTCGFPRTLLAGANLAVAVTVLLLAGAPQASAYYRPVFVAPPRPVMMPTFRPVIRPMVPAFRPAVRPVFRPMPRPVVRFAPRPVYSLPSRPIVRPPVQPLYRPPRLPAPRLTQPVVPAPSKTAPALAKPRLNGGAALTAGAPAAPPITIRPGINSGLQPPAASLSGPVGTKPPSHQQPIGAGSGGLGMVASPSPQKPLLSNTAGFASAGPSLPSAQSTTHVQPTLAHPQSTFTNKAIATAAAMNNTILESRPGQVLINTLAAAGSELAPKLAPLGYVGDAANIANAYIKAPARTDGLIAAGSELSGDIAVGIAGRLGGPIAAAGTQALVTAGDLYAAPALGNAMFNAAPGLFTPLGKATVNILAAPNGGAPLSAEEMNNLLVLK